MIYIVSSHVVIDKQTNKHVFFTFPKPCLFFFHLNFLINGMASFE